MHDIFLAAEMALRDLFREHTATLCQVLAFAAIVTPLLVLHGLRVGVIDTLTSDLVADPRTRQVNLLGDRLYEATWIEELRARKEVGFAMPHTRSLAANAEFMLSGRPDKGIERVSLLASGAGDPLLSEGNEPPNETQVVISTPLAKALGVRPGDDMTAILSRSAEGSTSRVTLDLAVSGVIDPALWQERGALVHLSVLIAFERWRDGFAIERYGWEGRPDSGRGNRFANVRLYAAELTDVRPLVERLLENGYLVSSDLSDVEALLGLDRSLGGIFAIISTVALSGYVLAFGATLWSNVQRKAPALGLLRLQGLQRSHAILFPLVQALVVACIGALLAAGLSNLTCKWVGFAFSEGLPDSAAACSLGALDYVAALLIGCAVSAAAATAAAVRVTRINAVGGLHHD